jgi:uncharacterized protein (DUF4415 family)
MTENSNATNQDLNDDELPDLSTDEWAAKIDAAPVRRGRPRAEVTKVPTTLRLDPDVVDAYKAQGKGWQTQMNKDLRKAIGL